MPCVAEARDHFQAGRGQADPALVAKSRDAGLHEVRRERRDLVPQWAAEPSSALHFSFGGAAEGLRLIPIWQVRVDVYRIETFQRRSSERRPVHAIGDCGVNHGGMGQDAPRSRLLREARGKIDRRAEYVAVATDDRPRRNADANLGKSRSGGQLLINSYVDRHSCGIKQGWFLIEGADFGWVILQLAH